MSDPEPELTIGDRFLQAVRIWGRGGPSRWSFLARAGWRVWRQNRLRKRTMERIGAPVPWVVEISPTQRCNYHCVGCYSRQHHVEDELAADELDALFAEAEELGVVGIVVTGGEPLLRPELPELMERHGRLTFVPFTNGALMTPEIAQRLARCGNVVPFVSIEGFPADTDFRRQPGAHDAALRALDLLRDAGACTAFSAMVTTHNADRLGSDGFVDEMIAHGCAIGGFSEYAPCGPTPRLDWVLSPEQRADFRRCVLRLRRCKPIVIVHFPDDEYGEANRCNAAGDHTLHINAQGNVEPCPFAPIACDNVRDGGLLAAFQSPYLRAIREHPTLLRRHRLPCAMLEHLDELKELAEQFG